MDIKIKKINELKPYSANPRNNKKSIDYVAKSIKEFGFKQPIVIDKDNVIVCGHTRYEASKKLKLKEVPCIIADDLTDEQIKAYRLADNKVSEFSEWDNDLLSTELLNIDFDMQEFGFEYIDVEEQHEQWQEETQERVANILNLEKAQYEGSGKYDIPMIQPTYEIPPIKEWIGFNYVLSDKNPQGKGVHFFIDDYQFERIWNNIDNYVDKLLQYDAVIAPDFSPYGDMPLATQIYNHYRKHWVARYLQERGVTVIPCIRASTDERSLDFYLDGTPRNSIVCISDMWTKNEEMRKYFIREYNLMYEALKPSKVLIYGREIEGLKGNIEYIETFAEKRWKKEVNDG